MLRIISQNLVAKFILSVIGAYPALAQQGEIHVLKSDHFQSVYYLPDSTAQRVEITVIVHSGEAANPFAEGLAHYVEHLVWLQINKSGEHAFSGHSNAFTTTNSTKYQFTGLHGEFSERLLMVPEIFAALEFDEKTLGEKEIIVSELQRRKDASPLFDTVQNQNRLLYSNLGPGRSVIGKPETIRRFKNSDAYSLHQATHIPSNSTLVVYGDLGEELVQGELDSLLFAKEKPEQEFKQVDFRVTKERIVQSHDVMGLIIPTLVYSKLVDAPIQSNLEHVQYLAFCAGMLEEYFSSSLKGSPVRELVYDKFLAKNLGVSIQQTMPGILELTVVATPDISVSTDTLLLEFERVLTELKEQGIPLKEFERLKNRRVERLKNVENPSALVRSMAIEFAEKKSKPVPHEEIIELVASLEYEDVQELVDVLADDARVVVQTLN